MVPINQNPYQGLKPEYLMHKMQNRRVPINQNPYQGLKPAMQ